MAQLPSQWIICLWFLRNIKSGQDKFSVLAAKQAPAGSGNPQGSKVKKFLQDFRNKSLRVSLCV